MLWGWCFNCRRCGWQVRFIFKRGRHSSGHGLKTVSVTGFKLSSDQWIHLPPPSFLWTTHPPPEGLVGFSRFHVNSRHRFNQFQVQLISLTVNGGWKLVWVFEDGKNGCASHWQGIYNLQSLTPKHCGIVSVTLKMTLALRLCQGT